MAPLHSSQFKVRRLLNWVPLGLTYALLNMARYNLTVAKAALGDLMSLEQFGTIFGIGAAVYGVSFVVNGPLTDRLGGRLAILTSAFGSAFANFALAWYTERYITSDPATRGDPVPFFAVVYALNMYFQSFGAVAIVKVNSNWFHVTERGTFSAIFGALISSGIFLAYDLGSRIVRASEGAGPEGVDATWWVFSIPAFALTAAFVVSFLLVRDTPGQAGHTDFDTGAAKMSEDESQPIPTLLLLRRILTNPIILTIGAIEFCTGIIRHGIMQWYPLYTKSALVLDDSHFLLANIGLIFFVAGVSGAALAGIVSDKLFQSRRGPAAAFLYALIVVATIVMIFALGGTKAEVGWVKPANEAATKVGLRTGDMVVALDKQPIADRAHFLVDVAKPGAHELHVLRAMGPGARTPLDVTVDGKAGAALELRKNLVTVKFGEKNEPALHWKGAWAMENRLTVGDVVVSVNGASVNNWEEVVKKLESNKDNELTVRRGQVELSFKAFYPPEAPDHGEEKARFLKAGPVQTLDPYVLGAIAFLISLCVIGTHGVLSGTATMDFGGKRGTATAVGVIDGMVYLGTAVQSFAIGAISARDWAWWPWFMLPFGIIGLYFCTRIWNAKPRAGGGH